MTPRPPIFISTVSKELRSARQLVANTLTFLGYQPIWQDIFGTEGGDLRGVLRQQIDQCKGVVQLIGQCYGAEPPQPDEKFGRVSYTQYEALYARDCGKKVWYLFIDETFPIDAHDPEPEELRNLQASYHRRLQADAHLFHSLASREALEASVLKLRDDLTRLRRGVKQWAAGVVILLGLIAGLVVWLVHGQGKAAKEIGETQKQMAVMTAEMTKMRQAITEYPRVDAQVRETAPKEDPKATQERVYTDLAKELGVDPKVLREKLPQLAEQIKHAADASSYERANAAYVAGDYLEAERLAMKAADETRKAAPTKPHDLLQALKLAGLSAQRLIHYDNAMEHFREAEKLTGREQSPVDWAEVQQAIADLLIDQGQYKDAENLLHSVIEVRTQLLGPEDPNTLRSRLALARVLVRLGKRVLATAELHDLIGLEQKVLGPEHPATLASRSTLAAELLLEGKYSDAETEFRKILDLREKVLGPQHRDTLASRMNLAVTLHNQGKYAEAEAENRAVLKLKEKLFGPEHPDTLASRMNLANDLSSQGKYAEAEAEHRAVLKLREKVLGPEHPDTLGTRVNIANALISQERYAEAETESRAVLKLMEKVLGPEHPNTVQLRMYLPWVLAPQGRYAEAEAEGRAVLKLLERVSGPEHPNTLAMCDALADVLTSENNIPEALLFSRRAVEGARKTLGPAHPKTIAYEKRLHDLENRK